MDASTPPLRTMIYVDGFNFYYRSLKNTPYKWLDLHLLAKNMLDEKKHEVVGIKYFTSRVQGTDTDPRLPIRQATYIRAIKAHCPNLSVIEGKFVAHKQWRPAAPPATGMVKIMHTEEKGTDVNIAVHLLNDAWKNLYDCAVLVSNDSDLAEALRLTRELGKAIGWFISDNCRPAKSLADLATFSCKIRREALAASQLPDNIPGTTIHKPEGW